MVRRSEIEPPPDDPEPAVQWTITHRDTFDRSEPSKVEATGQGIIPGLMELWGRFLLESVRGFSSFGLKVDGHARLVIDGDHEAAARLKPWVIVERGDHSRAVNIDVLYAVARAHAAFGLSDGGKRVLEIAAASRELDAFLAALITTRRRA